MALVVVEAAAEEPITLDEAKLHLRVVDTSEDELIRVLISAAREHVERICQIAIGDQTWRLTLDAFTTTIELPGGKVSAVNSLNYVDPLGDTQLMDSAAWRADFDSQPARLTSASDLGWPTTKAVTNAVAIEYAVGGECPRSVRVAMLMMIGDMYENRQQVVMNGRTAVAESPTVRRLLFPWRRVVP